MKFFVIVVSITILSFFSNAQNISVFPSSLQFDTLLVNTRDSLSFRLRNNSNDTLRVIDINTNKTAFSVRDTAFVVLPNDSARVWLYFQTGQNVTWTDVVLIENTGARGTLPLRVTGTAKFLGSEYASTQGLWENDLKTALFNLVNNHTVLGYNLARDRMYETIDDPLNNDTLECVYTGRRIYARNRTEAQNQLFNAEHSWPQSTFGSADPMQSDLHHLFPADEAANSARSNFPFGPVVSNITWQVGGSRLGRNPNGLTAFEPRDVHKGDVARVMFYFLLRYPNNYGNFMDVIQEFYLRQWYRTDPVSTKEILRNNAIATYQGKRNPLIDHPEFIDRISYFRSPVPPTLQPDILVSPASIQFRPVAFGDSSEWRLTIVNRGRASLAVTSVALQNPSSSFLVLDSSSNVPADSFAQVRVRFKPDQPNQTYTNTIVVQSNDPDTPTLSVNVAASSSGPLSVAQTILPNDFVLYQNYPNPFNPLTTISFTMGHSAFASLKVYDVLGRVVATLVDSRLNSGEYAVVWNASDASSGVYIYRLSVRTPSGNVDSAVLTKRMLLLK